MAEEENKSCLELINELSNDWRNVLLDCINDIDMNYIDNIYAEAENPIYPPKKYLFEAFKYFDLASLNVVILGQDPYHQPNQAHGLAFSVLNDEIPRSLSNIYSELKHEFPSERNSEQFNTGNLINWVNQGVLLLNTSLTVEESKPNIHSKFWIHITNNIIKHIDEKSNNIVYLLWGKNAEKKIKFIKNNNNFIIVNAHPSPLSANRGNWFYKSQFINCNHYLKLKGKNKIKWV